jgi:hypothetical protein
MRFDVQILWTSKKGAFESCSGKLSSKFWLLLSPGAAYFSVFRETENANIRSARGSFFVAARNDGKTPFARGEDFICKFLIRSAS